MIYLDSQTVAVEDFGDLRSMLVENNQYTHIHLATNIVMTAGVELNNARTQLTIDGEYPLGSGIIHTLREAGGDSGNIFLNRASRIQLTFQNLIIDGRNHYGMPRVADVAGNENVAVAYRNVTYSGPQLIWHPRGSASITDCNIEIVTVTGGSAANEICEIHAVEIGGTTRIAHKSSGSAVFYLYYANASLTILQDADVEITSTYDFWYRSGASHFIMEPRARLHVTSQRGFTRGSSHPIASFLVDEGASFRFIRQTSSGTDISMYVDGPLTVNRGAKFYMEVNYENNVPIIQYTDNSTSRNLTLFHPKSFVLYNRGTGTSASVFAFEASTPFTINTRQVNFWSVATPLEEDGGGFTDNAPGRWLKSDRSAFLIAGTAISRTTPPGTVITDTTLEAKDINPDSPLTMLQLNRAHAFSVGDLPLTVNRVVIPERRVTGTSEPSANVMITYEYMPFGERIVCVCNEIGDYTAPTQPGELPFGTMLQVTANTPFLLTTAAVMAVYDEDLNIEAPDIIEFVARPFALDPVMLPRRATAPEETPYRLVVTDSREEKTPWHIWAMITMPLQTVDQDILNDAVVYVTEDGETITLRTDVFEEIHVDELMENITVIEWAAERGVLLRILGSIRCGKEYTTRLLWEVRPIIEEEVVEDDPE